MNLLKYGGSLGLMGFSVVVALAYGDFRPSLWAPNLACSLFSTGVAVLVINVFLAGLQERESRRRDGSVLMKPLQRVLLRLGLFKIHLSEYGEDTELLGTQLRRLEVASRRFMRTVEQVKPALRPDTVVKAGTILDMMQSLADLPLNDWGHYIRSIEVEIHSLWKQVGNGLAPLKATDAIKP